MPQVDPVILQLKADVAAYQRDVTRATKLSEEKLDRISRAGFATGVTLRKGFDLAKGAAIGFASAITIDVVANAIKTGLDYAASLGEIAAQAGVTTTQLQELYYAGTQVNLSQQEVVQLLEQLTRRTGDAAMGVKESAQAFEKLGIDIRGANGEVKNAAELIPEIAQGLQSVDSEAERAAIKVDLFGRAGQKAGALLEGGAAGVNNLRDAAHKLGVVLSEDQIARADETADKLDAMKTVLTARIAGAVADNSNAILALARAFERLVTAAGAAVKAYERFKLNQGRIQADLNAGAYGLSPLGSDQRKALGFRQEAQRFRTAIGNLDATALKPGEVRTLSGKTSTFKPLGDAKSRLSGSAPLASSGLIDALSGPTGNGAGIAALLGADPTLAVRAVNAITAELESLEADIAAARAEMSGDLREQAAAEKQRIDARLRSDTEQVRADTDNTKTQQDEIISRRTIIASLEKQAVDARLAEDMARENLEAAERQRDARDANMRLELDALSAESDLADTRAERLAIERRILELQQESERRALDEAIGRGEIADAVAARAALERRQGSQRAGLERDFEGPLARYARDVGDAREQVEEAAARRIADLNDTIADTMTKALGIKDPFLRSLLQIFLDQNLFGPIADALSRGSSGGGLFGAILSGIGLISGAKSGGLSTDGGLTGGFLKTRASGGYVSAGTMYRVNEGASPGRVEGFIPQGSGNIIPLGRMNATGGGGGGSGVVRIIVEEGPNFLSTIRTEATGVAIEVQKVASPAIVNAAVNETMRQANRPRI